jgi:quercetin dioxygenase-like cupin family protein
MRTIPHLWLAGGVAAVLALGLQVQGHAADAPAAADATGVVRELMLKALVDAPAKEVRMLTVEYPPGGASPPHSHHAQVFVYVLSGSVHMQVQGGKLVTLGPGDTFYEGRDDVHTVSANASRTDPAKMLVVMVQDRSPARARVAPAGSRP